jgi:choline transport protein
MAEILRRGSKISTDSETLALLGKKQVLKRRFGFWSLFAFAVCELITWETVLALFSQGKAAGFGQHFSWLMLIRFR